VLLLGRGDYSLPPTLGTDTVSAITMLVQTFSERKDLFLLDGYFFIATSARIHFYFCLKK
jgi:hypothetical protein